MTYARAHLVDTENGGFYHCISRCVRRSWLCGAAALSLDAGHLAELRARLGSLSWFMRFINEPIARRANREDGVKGRFWEGRFKSIAPLDEAAVVACMAYVDLNPVRARLVERAEEATHTALHRRIRHADGDDPCLAPLSVVGLRLPDYRALLDWTVAVERGGVAPPAEEAARALACLHQKPDSWLGQVKAHRVKYRAHGALGLLRGCAEALGQRYLWGAKPGLAAPG